MKMMTPPWEMKPTLTIQKIRVSANFRKLAQVIYTLSLGINTIGRKAQTSNATVQIDTDDLTMSRSHSIIEVRKLKTGGYIHYFSNAQNKNATYINSGLIENGDRIILHGGEIIKMSNTTLKFILLSEDDTII